MVSCWLKVGPLQSGYNGSVAGTASPGCCPLGVPWTTRPEPQTIVSVPRSTIHGSASALASRLHCRSTSSARMLWGSEITVATTMWRCLCDTQTTRHRADASRTLPCAATRNAWKPDQTALLHGQDITANSERCLLNVGTLSREVRSWYRSILQKTKLEMLSVLG